MSKLRANSVETLDGKGQVGLTFNSVSQLKSSTTVKPGQTVSTKGYYADGDGGSNDYVIELRDGQPDSFLTEYLDDGLHQARFLRGTAIEDVTVLIPTQYEDIQAAFNGLYRRLYAAKGVKILLSIESGHTLESLFNRAVTLRNGDFSSFWIQSVDAVVPANFAGRFLDGENCVMPVLDCLVDMQGVGTDGYYIRKNVRYYITPGSGVINAGNQGFSAKFNCHGNAAFTKWSGAGQDGIWAEQTCTGDFEGAEAENVGRWGIFANHGSSLCARLFKGANAGEHCAYSRHMSTITLFDADLTGAGVSDIRAEFGGNLDVGGATYNTTSLLNQSSAFINQRNTKGLIADTNKPGNEDAGNWTPTLEGFVTSGANTYEKQSGRYRRQGRLVWIYGRIKLSAKDAAMDGSIFIRGLPFAPSSFVNSGADIARVRDINLPSGFLGFGNGRLNTDGIQVLYSQSNETFPMAGLDQSHITDTTEIFFSAVYELDLAEIQALGLQ